MSNWTLYKGQAARLDGTMNPEFSGGIAGWTLRLRLIQSGSVALTVSPGTVDGAQTWYFDLTSAQTSTLSAGTYTYDVWRIDSGNEYPILTATVTVVDNLEVPTTPTIADKLQTAKLQVVNQLVEITANPKPSYSVDGQSVSWSDYQRMLLDQIERLNVLIAAESPFEVRSMFLP